MTRSINLTELALKLVQIPSATGDEPAVLAYLEDLAKLHCFTAERIPVDQTRYNLHIYPTNSQTSLLLTTHIDTVPGGPTAEIRADRLIGRGACDAKGIAAAMFCALVDLVNAGHRDTSLLLVVGEETNSDGAQAASHHLARRRFFINGEPTENQFVRAQRGVVSGTVRCIGHACHSGYPHLGHSATHDLIAILSQLLATSWPSDPLVGETLVNVGTVSGGSAANVLAERAEAALMIRVATRAEEIVRQLGAIVSPRGELLIKSASDPQHLHVPTGEKECVVGYGSDIAHLRPLGTPLMYGPGSISQAHTISEWVSLTELADARTKYRDICLKLSQGSEA
jgi:acetylornithine deacetylase